MAKNGNGNGRDGRNLLAVGIGAVLALLLGGVAAWAAGELRRQKKQGGPAPVLLTRPGDAAVRRYRDGQRGHAVSYAPVGVTEYGPGHAPPGYPINRTRERVGSGAADFERARAALREWAMYALPWIDLCWPDDAPIRTGTVSAVRARVLFLWVISVTRVLYVIDEPDGEGTARFGFGIGTLPGHVEQGEERFLVEWDKRTGEVWFDIYAFARARHPLAVLAYPVTRYMQRRFAREAVPAMRKAIAGR
jgi:uncharacterized protein (UPF0548 family)